MGRPSLDNDCSRQYLSQHMFEPEVRVRDGQEMPKMVLGKDPNTYLSLSKNSSMV